MGFLAADFLQTLMTNKEIQSDLSSFKLKFIKELNSSVIQNELRQSFKSLEDFSPIKKGVRNANHTRPTNLHLLATCL